MTRAIQYTVVPKGYDGKNFNRWQLQLQRQIDRIAKTTVTAKLEKVK